MKKLVVNHDACIGCGACVAIAPKNFDFNDDGLSEVISNDFLDSEEVKNAIASCPTNAISCAEGKNGNCTCENCKCEDCQCEHDKNCECKDCECTCGENCECENCECNHCSNTEEA